MTDPCEPRSTSPSHPIADNRSRLSITIAFTGHGIGKLLVPLVVEREARKEMPANLAALKEHLERDR